MNIFKRRQSDFRPKGDNRFYLELDGKKLPVIPQFDDQCVDLDVDEDRFVDNQEFKYLTQSMPFRVDRERYTLEHKHAWTHTPLPELALYPSYEQVSARLDELVQKYPGRCEKVSLGRSHQGREIWALRLGEEARGQQPGVVITGGTHAREWASIAVPLDLAETLLQDGTRLKQAEIWIVPLVNPDGYEISRSGDNTYRKNGNPEGAVDLNRNFGDSSAEHAHLWRPEGDKPGIKYDDKGASDDPKSRQYRGTAPASEPETQAVLKLELENKNILGVVDNHNCGEMLLYPAAGDKAFYEALADTMNAAAGGEPYKVMAAPELYPVSGISNDIQHAHGIIGMTLESGLSMQPPAALLDLLKRRANRAHLAFIDKIIENKDNLTRARA
ncbi:MAG: M14 family zinc carboxypeptidase [Vulcanimicrobiota bacterium]